MSPGLAYARSFEPVRAYTRVRAYARKYARTRHPYAAKINCVELITYIIGINKFNYRYRLDTKQVAEQDASCHRKEASDGAHVAKDRDDEGVGQVGGGLATTYR